LRIPQTLADRIARKQLPVAERIALDDESPALLRLVVSPYAAAGFTIPKSLHVLRCPDSRVGSTDAPPRVDLALAGRRFAFALRHI
jgi:hypothetical protein